MSSHESTTPEQHALDYEHSGEQDEWPEDSEELPLRPRRRLLTPVPLALLAVLLLACGFIAGVEVQKDQMSPVSAPGALSRSFAGGLATAGAGAFAAARRSGAAGVTTGEVSYVRGNTLYVIDSQGNTVKVSAAADSRVTKTVGSRASAIHPGETVVVLGAAAKNGSIRATSISVGSATPGGAGSAGVASSAASPATAGGAPALFGAG